MAIESMERIPDGDLSDPVTGTASTGTGDPYVGGPAPTLPGQSLKSDGNDGSAPPAITRGEKREAKQAAEDAEDTYVFLAEDAVNGDEAARDSLAVALTGKSYGELEQAGDDVEFMAFLKDVASGRLRPEIRVAGRDDGQGTEGKTEGDWLPSGVNGAYVPGEAGAFESGTILVAQGLEGDELRETMLEEYGEALADLADGFGVEVHEGDAGARLARVAGGDDNHPILDTEDSLFDDSPLDEVTVVVDGKEVTARANAKAPAGFDPAAAYVPTSEGETPSNAKAVDSFVQAWGGKVGATGEHVVTAERFAEATGISADTAGRLGQYFYPGAEPAYFTKQQIGAMMADGLIPATGAFVYGQPVTFNAAALDGGRVANALVDASMRVNGYAPTSADSPMSETELHKMFEDLFTTGSISIEEVRKITHIAPQFNTDRTVTGASIRDIKNFINMGYIKIDLGTATTAPSITTAFPEDIAAAGEAALVPASAEGAHTEPGFWQSLWGEVSDPVKLVSDIASFSGHAEADIAKFFNNEMDHAEALGKGMHKAIIAFGEEIQKGTESAILHLESFGSALKSGLGALAASASKHVDHLVLEAKKAGGELALHALIALAGMSKEDANKMLHEMGAKFDLLNHLDTITLDDVKAMVPDFDAKVEQGQALHDERVAVLGAGDAGTVTVNRKSIEEMTPENAFLNLENRPQMRGLLMQSGMTVGDDGSIMMADGTVATDADKQDFYDQHMRIDIAPLELNGVWANGGLAGTGIDVNQLRPFLTMPRRNEDGEWMMEFRLRELDLTGAAAGTGAAQGDAGLIGVRDFIVPFHVSGSKAGQRGDLKWVDTTGVIAEWTPKAGPAVIILGVALTGVSQGVALAGYFGGSPNTLAVSNHIEHAGKAIDRLGNYIGDRGSLEIGGGVGFSTTYNLSQLGDHWWTPMAAEIGGAVVGGGIGAGILGATEVLSEGGATPVIEKIGPIVVQGGAKLGAMAADMIYSKASGSSVETSFGVFGWGAYLQTWTQGTTGDAIGTDATPTPRTRVQVNFDNSWDLNF